VSWAIACSRFRRLAASLLPAAVLLIAGCAGGAGATFSPEGPCLADGRAPGSYPGLEALVPATYDGRPPDRLDSGRNCSPANLGTLAGHGIRELRFGGGLWELNRTEGVTLAVFEADALEPAWLAEFYEAGARAGRRTGLIESTRPTIAGRPGHRLDTRNGDSRQSVLVWPSSRAGVAHVVLAADVSEDRIQAAVAAFDEPSQGG
jgi:hypothetical protein